MSGSETVYAVRLSAPFTQVLVSEHTRLETINGPDAADQWVAGLMETVRSLATLPERCVVAPEDRLLGGATVRQIVYGRRRGGPAWRILFTVQEADENDPPMVWVQVLRHGAQGPMTEWPSDNDGGA